MISTINVFAYSIKIFKDSQHHFTEPHCKFSEICAVYIYHIV